MTSFYYEVGNTAFRCKVSSYLPSLSLYDCCFDSPSMRSMVAWHIVSIMSILELVAWSSGSKKFNLSIGVKSKMFEKYVSYHSLKICNPLDWKRDFKRYSIRLHPYLSEIRLLNAICWWSRGEGLLIMDRDRERAPSLLLPRLLPRLLPPGEEAIG